jgi:hypothetical protein
MFCNEVNVVWPTVVADEKTMVNTEQEQQK